MGGQERVPKRADERQPKEQEQRGGDREDMRETEGKVEWLMGGL